jgi:catechol 2,3-dioxygenase-like lactoylglutathione lyase family enzyme
MSIVVESVVHVGIPVSDIERSLQFYHDALGLQIDSSREVSGEIISAGVQVPDARIKITLLDAGTVKLELLQYLEPEGRPHDRRNNDVGASHVAFVVADIQGTYERLQELGMPCNTPPYPATHPEGWGWFYARDPDGITVEFNGPLNQE